MSESKRNSPLILPQDEFNQKLVGNVHPSDWVNPTPAKKYNLVVIGGGTAGLVTAAGAAGLGGKVALVERHLMGGDCLNVGCVPSKSILRSAKAIADFRSAETLGVDIKGEAVKPSFEKIMTRMRKLRSWLSPVDSALRFQELGVDVFLGEGKFLGPETIDVGGAKLRFSRAVVATGTHPRPLAVPGVEGVGYLTNDSVFSLTKLPKSLVVIGGGPIGCELAQGFHRFGCKVTLLAKHERLLPRDDHSAAEIIQKQFSQEGIDLRFGAKIIRLEKKGNQKIVHLEIKGASHQIEGEEILVSIGRVPNTESLNLEAANIQFGHLGVAADDHLRTSNPKVYAAGDICSTFKFTHAAEAMARIVIQNALFFGSKRISQLVIPWATYTDPEVAHVGVSGEIAAQDSDIGWVKVELSEIDRAVLDGETEGYAQAYFRKKGGRVVGGTIVARHAGEMIGELVMAIRHGLSMSDLADTIHPYPTQADIIRHLGNAYQRKRLTPVVQKGFKGFLRLRR